MNSRERIKLAIEHKESDKIPVDLGSMRSTGISTIAYNNLKKKLGINHDLSFMYDFIQQLAYPDEEIRNMFKIDVIDVGQGFLNNIKWKKWNLNDGSPCLIPEYLNIEIDTNSNIFLKDKKNNILGKKPSTSLYVDQAYWPYKNLKSIPNDFNINDITKQMWSIPSPPWHLNVNNHSEYRIFINGLKELCQNSNYSTMLSMGHNIFEIGTFLRGWDNYLCDIYIDRKGVERFIDKLVENYLELLAKILNDAKDYLDIIQFGDDLGSQQGPFIPTDVFKKLFKPQYKRMWNFVHENSDCKVFLHSCGSIYELIPDLIDAGLDILNPIQTSALNMEPEKLKKDFGKDITFWGGGCDTINILPNGKPEEVKEHVKRRIEIFNKNGGFVFNQIHNILSDVPPENIVAMFEAVNEYN
jgi:uroporphyrinogen decarboxylase